MTDARTCARQTGAALILSHARAALRTASTTIARLLIAGLVVLACGHVEPVNAGDAQYEIVNCASTNASAIEGHWATLRFAGPITPDTPAVFERMLAEAQSKCGVSKVLPAYFVVISSRGGDVAAAMKIGRRIRETGGAVMVGDVFLIHDGCHSSCILILAAGLSRLVSERAVVSLHRPYFAGSNEMTYAERQQKYRAMFEAVRDYLREMNFTDALFEAMMAVPPDEARQLAWEESRQFTLSGSDPVFQEQQDISMANALGITRGEYNARLARATVECSGRADAAACRNALITAPPHRGQ